jgi:hypothetical protein
LWWENLKGKDHSEDVEADGNIIVELILGKYDGKLWTGCIGFRAGSSGELL